MTLQLHAGSVAAVLRTQTYTCMTSYLTAAGYLQVFFTQHTILVVVKGLEGLPYSVIPVPVLLYLS